MSEIVVDPFEPTVWEPEQRGRAASLLELPALHDVYESWGREEKA